MKENKISKIGKTVVNIGVEGLTEIKNQGVKTFKDIKNIAMKAYENVKENLDFKKAFNEATEEFIIVGATNILSQPIKIRAFVLNNHELLLKYDDHEINRIISGILLKNTADGKVIKIINIDSKKLHNHEIIVNDEQCVVPCFKAKYKFVK
ncbi:MAG TPA: hypothetical protein GXZ48_00165 [Acholeplasmataceae bacterium]|nr:hypothetical protein [Acholeplasmataceae bacterium]